MLLQHGVEYFNPDEAARRILSANPGMAHEEANSAAWHEGRRLLERAIAERGNFAFETTLGGKTITGLLGRLVQKASRCGSGARGLNSPELHIARVRSRASKGGHDIPTATIRDRYDRSRLHLIRLLPKLTELRVYDNSEEADPSAGKIPEPTLILHLAAGEIISSCDLRLTPEWAKPILLTALKTSGLSERRG